MVQLCVLITVFWWLPESTCDKLTQNIYTHCQFSGFEIVLELGKL